MKQQISQSEFASLDMLAIAADGIQDAQAALIIAMERALGVDDWDADKRAAIASYVGTGARIPIEQFVERLGVAVSKG